MRANESKGPLRGFLEIYKKKQDPPWKWCCRGDLDIPRLNGLKKRVKNLLPSLCLCRRLSISLSLCLCHFFCLHTCVRLCLCLCHPNTNSKQTLISPIKTNQKKLDSPKTNSKQTLIPQGSVAISSIFLIPLAIASRSLKFGLSFVFFIHCKNCGYHHKSWSLSWSLFLLYSL